MNIYDIAREAGVSIATVSRVLNHKDTVRADTRAKVEKVLKRCNYAPSAIAQGMVSKSLHTVAVLTVAVLTVDIRDPHYARTVYTIERGFGVPVVEEIWESAFKNRPFFKELSIDKSVSGL